MSGLTEEGSNGTDAAPRLLRPSSRSISLTSSYAVILLLVAITYIVSVSVTESRAASIVLTVQLATVWITLRTSNAHRLVRLVAYVVLCLAVVIAVVGFFVHEQGNQLGAIFTVCCVLYLIAPFSIVRDLVGRPAVDRETLLGALAAYILIGMFFAFAYKAASEFGKVPFFGTAGAGSLSQDLFFSFVTMTTVGYGDLVPAANPGQTLAVMEALIGQLFLVVAIGKVINVFTPQRRKRSGS